MSIFKREIRSHEITDGLVLKDDAPFDTEPRYLTLLMKGLIVYLVVMGSMGCILSSFTIPYNALLLHLSVLVASLFSAFLYFTKIWENLGYLVMFIGMFGSAVMLRKFISSGFFAVVNIISERAAYYFDTEVVQGYAESISDRNVTVTIAFIYIGWVFAILLNALISRQMKYFAVLFTAFVFLTIPFYLECEPDMLYILILMAGTAIVFVFRGGRHTPITPDDRKYEYRSRKRYINYVYSFRHHLAMIAVICLSVLIFGGIFQLFFNKYDFESANRGRSEWKIGTENTMENIYKTGIWGLFNRYESNGGLKSGVLGGVSSVNLDYETDLEVTYVPYSSDRMYLRAFTGTEYLPFDNRWQRGARYNLTTQRDDDSGKLRVGLNREDMGEETTSLTAKALKTRYEDGLQMSAKARMDIKNIAAGLLGFFPYYVDEEDSESLQFMSYRQVYTVDFYPWLTDPGPVKVLQKDGDGKEKSDPYAKRVISDEKMYLSVPRENVEAVDAFISEAGLDKYRSVGSRALDAAAGNSRTDNAKRQPSTDAGAESDDGEMVMQAIQALGAYYQENIPYTYSPGVIPRGEDFINYFLKDNKKGYCAHFAAASTLILRRLGYQARYIEGYAIDPIDIIEDSKTRNDLKVTDYYNGDNRIGGDASVITVNVTDANAHAWVEVLIDGHWRVAELTPWSDEEPPDGSFFERLIDFFAGTGSTGSSSSDGSEVTGTAVAGLDTMGRILGYGFLILFICAAVAFLVYILFRLIRGRLIYIRADRSDRLVLDFKRLSKKAEKREKTINYRDRLRVMRESGLLSLGDKECDELLDILEQAGFSGAEISKEEYDRAVRMLKGK